jgi:manganese transport protein
MWLRRMITRLVAIVPAAFVAALYGESGTAKLLVLSQVILSLQLPFAMVPLVKFTGDKTKMGRFANKGWLKGAAYLICAVVITLNVTLLWNTFT